MHTKEPKPLQCEYCQKKFSQRGNLKSHITLAPRRHTTSVNIIRKGLSKVSNDQKSHKGEPHANVNTCIYIRFHTKEKSYQCEYCLKRFSQCVHLKMHIRIHTIKEKPYQCERFAHSYIHTRQILSTH